MQRCLIWCAVFVGLIAAVSAARADDCPAVAMPPIAVPHLHDALAANQPVVIVALGSSSTQSWMSSDAAHSYPAVLQAALTAALPKAHIAVINRGIGGQDAAEEVTRLDTDALALRPQLVVWQVGANGVLRHTDVAVFKKLVVAGIKRMLAANLDIILMDNQRAPRIIAAPDHLLIDQALAEIAHDTGVGLFARSLLMDGWAKDGASYGDFISPDGLHHNDHGYRCMGQALAASIVAGLGPSPRAVADAKSK